MENPFRADSKVSTMRIAMVLCVLAAVIVALIAAISMACGVKVDLSGCSILVGALLVPAFGGKVGQSITEAKNAVEKIIND